MQGKMLACMQDIMNQTEREEKRRKENERERTPPFVPPASIHFIKANILCTTQDHYHIFGAVKISNHEAISVSFFDE